MNHKFLIGNTFSGSGKVISDLINRFGFDSKCCGNNLEVIYNEIQKERYNGIIFYMRGYNEETFDLLQKMVNDNPKLRIYAIMMIRSDVIEEKLLSIGIRKCLDVTNTPIEVYSAVVMDDDLDEERIYVPEIINYLYNKKIPYDLIGFNYLAVGIKKCIEDPSIADSKMKTVKMYPAIAEACTTSYAAVERGLRKIAHIAESNKIIFNGMACFMRLTAGKMVIEATKEYSLLKNEKNQE